MPRRLLAPLALVSALLLGSTGPVQAAPLSSYARTGELLGVDVSHWNGAPRWAAAKEAGVKFVIAKATEAQRFVDSQYARNKGRADALGIRFTAYHFAQPDRTSGDAVLEADHFVRTASLSGRHLLPVLDLEVHGGLSQKRLIEWARTWVRRVEQRLGVKPMIYTSPSFWVERMGNTRWFADNGNRLWIAHWGAAEPRVPAANWGGRGWTMWQVSDCAKVAGINGCVDVDRFRGTRLGGLKIDNNR